MRRYAILLPIALYVSLSICSAALSAEANGATNTQGAAAIEQQSSLGERDESDPFYDEPMYRFYQARQDFLLKDLGRAAAQIRRGGAYLVLETAKATGPERDDLVAARQQLETVASGVKNGTVVSFKVLDNTFAAAERALARHHVLRASALWTEGNPKLAGKELFAAARHFEQALVWFGHELEEPHSVAVDRAVRVAQQLDEGKSPQPAPQDISQTIKGLQTAIGGLDKISAPTGKQ